MHYLSLGNTSLETDTAHNTFRHIQFHQEFYYMFFFFPQSIRSCRVLLEPNNFKFLFKINAVQ
jgi:hypothetical protein